MLNDCIIFVRFCGYLRFTLSCHLRCDLFIRVIEVVRHFRLVVSVLQQKLELVLSILV